MIVSDLEVNIPENSVVCEVEGLDDELFKVHSVIEDYIRGVRKFYSSSQPDDPIFDEPVDDTVRSYLREYYGIDRQHKALEIALCPLEIPLKQDLQVITARRYEKKKRLAPPPVKNKRKEPRSAPTAFQVGNTQVSVQDYARISEEVRVQELSCRNRRLPIPWTPIGKTEPSYQDTLDEVQRRVIEFANKR
jgi:hypothetical protein